MTKCLKVILQKVLEVAIWQLADFMQDGVFGGAVSQEVRNTLEKCPLTNLSGEHAFGDLDYNIQTKRHASLHHRSTSNMLKQNKTVAWLAGKSETEREHVLKASRKCSKALRTKHQQQEEVVRLQVQERIIDNERKKKEKELQVAVEKQRIMDCVLKHGGPVRSVQDIQAVSCSGVEALKNQLKYLKVILGKRVKVSGTKVQLEAALKVFVKGDESSIIVSPPRKRRKILEDDSSFDSSNSSSSSSSSDDDDADTSTDIFTYERQGQWLAVYYDLMFYIGQVIDVQSKSTATIKFLAPTKGRKDYFRWPLADDAAQVESTFVFLWDFDVSPVSSDGRICVFLLWT